ncbi:MAG TPA: IGHMBP2 family helicase [Persephonella sp.]|uniref:Putative DNA helicase n=1 Tax=Persephonella marina (strain DSM 14350 / EX-H1) TaxID=123214 RepID=C0QRI9_PERMH|nr:MULTISPECIES: IGHMBP2 family helicase [Persephonella]ACO03594.1 putative DNA helicase [Persephonella marina EX-H1]HCB69030.1 IGHMBP2 family helicase [Persephonella sp.]
MRLRFKDKQEYVTYWENLVELEREAEKDFHLNEILSLSGKERQKKGRAILGLQGRYIGEIIGDFQVYRFFKEDMPDHQINVGDVVLVSRKHPLRDGIEGTVFEKGKHFITVVFSQILPSGKKWRIDLFVNDITFKRMSGTLHMFEKGYSFFPEDTVLGDNGYTVCEEEIQFFNESLNQFQREAVKKAVCSDKLFMIHGPPGTGKTTTLLEVIIQHVSKGDRVLATADSNTAVDNIVEGLVERGVNVVRIGHPARLKKELLDVSLDAVAESHPDYNEVRSIEKKIKKLKSLQESYKKPTAQRRRGLSYSDILKYAKSGKKVRGHRIETLKSMAEWIRLQKEIKKLSDRKRKIEDRIINDILNSAEVICATNSTAGSEFLSDYVFDVVFIDEASQSTEPSCLIPVIKGLKVVMAGDHKQLPPTVLNPDAKDLSFTMFERFMKIYPENTYMLKIQYRMNDIIKQFPSEEFYDGQLISDESVKDRKLSDITGKEGDAPITDDTPVVFIDTEGKFLEKQKKGSRSKYNPEEAKAVKSIVEKLKEIGVLTEDIGVITPYKDHEDYLKKIIPDVEVKTVDGFQGREKEVIVISLVRSNPEEEIGFLDDLRRLNVALTRAKRKVIIIGDSKTLSSNETYRKLIKFIKEKGTFVTVEEISLT